MDGVVQPLAWSTGPTVGTSRNIKQNKNKTNQNKKGRWRRESHFIEVPRLGRRRTPSNGIHTRLPQPQSDKETESGGKASRPHTWCDLTSIKATGEFNNIAAGRPWFSFRLGLFPQTWTLAKHGIAWEAEGSNT